MAEMAEKYELRALADEYRGFTLEKALAEANRCLLCAEAPCEQGCPAQVPVKEFIRNIRAQNFLAAYHLIQSQNIMATICGRVCNAAATCQKQCTSQQLLRPIAIQKLQQFVCDMFVGTPPLIAKQPVAISHKVAIVGGGPAGLSAAYELWQSGISVTLYEKSSVSGGVPVASIPNYRITKQMIDKELSWLSRLDIDFVLDHEVKPQDVCQLQKEYRAIIIATGLTKNVEYQVPGFSLQNVCWAKDVLCDGKLAKPRLKLGREVVVIGGGNAAIDAAISAVGRGSKVTVIYRRSERQMPAWLREIVVAKELGVNFQFLTNVVAINGQKQVSGITCELMRFCKDNDSVKSNAGSGVNYGGSGNSGGNRKVGGSGHSGGGQRPQVEPVPNVRFEIACDMVILGVGERFDESWFSQNNLTLEQQCNSTNQPNIFCCGDLITQEKSVVHAVADGKRCAKAVLNYLGVSPQLATKSSYFPKEHKRFHTSFCGVNFINPFILAAAPPTDDLTMVQTAFSKGWAGAVLKTTSVAANEVPLKYPMMTGYKIGERVLSGLGNIDLISEHHIDVVEQRIRILKQDFPDRVVIASIMGASQDDWQSLVRRLESAGVDMIECSFSCPQGTLGAKPGFMLGQDAALVKQVASWIKQAAKRVPVVIKITPQVTDIVAIARAVKASGADAICASNSIPALMGIDLENFVPFPNVGGKSTYSGFTGPAIKPLTLRTIAEIKRHVDIPITGTGGPVNWRDAVELMAVGATTVQFCTAVMHYGFDIIDDLLSGLYFFMAKHNFQAVGEIVGKSLPFITTHDELQQSTKIVSTIDQTKCIKCGECYIACRDGGHGAIDFNLNERAVVIDTAKCVGCALCTHICPVADCMVLKPL